MDDSRSCISGGSEASGGGSSNEKGPFFQAENVYIQGGTFNQAGTQKNFYGDRSADEESLTQGKLLSALKDIPNYRDIHSANLGRATDGTGPQFAEWAEYCEWLKAQGGIKAMWGTGMPGAGKTIFFATVLDKVEAYAKATNLSVCIGYIYFRYSDHTKATTRDCLEVLVKQTIERHPECLEICASIYTQHARENTRPSERELMELLRQLAQVFVATFYFLDAMDEAPRDVQRDLISKLSTLNVQLFITSRPMEALQSRFPDVHCYPIRAQDRDLDLHIKKVISQSVDLQNVLDAGGPDLYHKVAATVKEKCGGMFLHASLQLDALRDCTSSHGVDTVLANFPPRIEDVYAQTWQRIQDQPPKSVEVAKATLIWVLCAERSLKIDELRHLAAACPKTHRIESGRLVEARTLMALCRGLISLEQGTNIVRFVHYTAKDVVKNLLSVPESSLHALPAQVCVTLLEEHGLQNNMDSIHSQWDLQQALYAKPALHYAYDAWSFHAKRVLNDSAMVGRVASFILGCGTFPVLIEPKSYRIKGRGRGPYVPDILLLDHCGPVHMVACFDLPLSMAGLQHLHKPNVLSSRGLTPLMMSVVMGSSKATREFLDLPFMNLDQANRKGARKLLLALSLWARRNSAKVLPWHPKVDVNKYVQLPKAPRVRGTHVPQGPTLSRTALMIACIKGLGELVDLLVSHPGTKVNLVDTDGISALMLACRNGRTESVRCLLAHPHIDLDLLDKDGMSALDHAQRHPSVRQLLAAHPRNRKRSSPSIPWYNWSSQCIERTQLPESYTPANIAGIFLSFLVAFLCIYYYS